MKDLYAISDEMTVNEIVQTKPDAVAVFARYGIDTCCGGALPLSEVARRHNLDLAAVLEALNEGPPSCCSTR